MLMKVKESIMKLQNKEKIVIDICHTLDLFLEHH